MGDNNKTLEERITELERRLSNLESGLEESRVDRAEIRLILDEIINMDSSADGQRRAALRRIRDLLKKYEGGK